MRERERHSEVTALKRRSEHYRKGCKIISMYIRAAVRGAETLQHTYKGIKTAASDFSAVSHNIYIIPVR